VIVALHLGIFARTGEAHDISALWLITGLNPATCFDEM
jgi:hypothetical protein